MAETRAFCEDKIIALFFYCVAVALNLAFPAFMSVLKVNPEVVPISAVLSSDELILVPFHTDFIVPALRLVLSETT